MYNYSSNRIEVSLEFKFGEYTNKLNFNEVIPYAKPYRLIRKAKRNQQSSETNKTFTSILFRFQNVTDMVPVYDYFMKNRLYSDFKFYRISKIKPFIELRQYKESPPNTAEYSNYRSLMLDFIQYLNPS